MTAFTVWNWMKEMAIRKTYQISKLFFLLCIYRPLFVNLQKYILETFCSGFVTNTFLWCRLLMNNIWLLYPAQAHSIWSNISLGRAWTTAKCVNTHVKTIRYFSDILFVICLTHQTFPRLCQVVCVCTSHIFSRIFSELGV